MKTRRLHHVSLNFDVEHRTEGWYYRVEDLLWEGPYKDVGELTDQFGQYYELHIRWLYELIHKEAPR